MDEAQKKSEAPKIGAKPEAPNVVAHNAKDPATTAKTAAPKAVMKSIPRIICGLARKFEKKSVYKGTRK